MKRATLLTAIFTVSLVVFVLLPGTYNLLRDVIDDAYCAGYEQCAQDTSLYLMIKPGVCGIHYGLRRYLIESRPSPQTEADMRGLIKQYESQPKVQKEMAYWAKKETAWLRADGGVK